MEEEDEETPSDGQPLCKELYEVLEFGQRHRVLSASHELQLLYLGLERGDSCSVLI